MTHENADVLLRTRDVAHRLDLAPETVRRMAHDGRLASLRLPSGEYRFRPTDLQALVAEAAGAETADPAAVEPGPRGESEEPT